MKNLLPTLVAPIFLACNQSEEINPEYILLKL